MKKLLALLLLVLFAAPVKAEILTFMNGVNVPGPTGATTTETFDSLVQQRLTQNIYDEVRKEISSPDYFLGSSPGVNTILPDNITLITSDYQSSSPVHNGISADFRPNGPAQDFFWMVDWSTPNSNTIEFVIGFEDFENLGSLLRASAVNVSRLQVIETDPTTAWKGVFRSTIYNLNEVAPKTFILNGVGIIPEPASLMLLSIGILCIWSRRL